MGRKKISLLAVLCFAVSMQTEMTITNAEAESKFKVIDTAFCPESEIDYDRKWCQSSNVKFPVNIGKLYCYTRIFAPENVEIYHNWIFEGETVSSVKLNVKRSGSYRTRSYKSLFPKHVGEWKVEIEAEGKVLATLPFTITPSEEPSIDLPTVGYNDAEEITSVSF